MRTTRKAWILLVAALCLAGGLVAPIASATGSDARPIRCTASGRAPITVVFVHGAWADNSSWTGEVNELLRDGCNVRAADVHVQDLAADAAAVANFLRTIPGPVLLVGHSYGGAVISNAAAEVSNVVGLVYVDAYEPAVGEAISDLGGATSAIVTHPASELFEPIPGAPSGQQNLILQQTAYSKYFANDLPRAQAVEQWATQTVASTAALTAPTTQAAWKTLPSWSFISTGDQIITPQSLLAMSHRAHSHITLFKGGSHVTLVSHPQAVTAVVGTALSSLLHNNK
ncbi:alpha/beta hydrolase [Kribbella jiaozuonensis]|uniref:Alpha/beta hydrolase n=1 Tax=Kribbella jiaozuonensis TaxID=2575441 RepID=A0A4U3M255_9ACTN|nr:alpha/beta hydrolase [Kribbella jiaozuonensis]TKK82808.1 alpha/beta hydrolase [Kribbella jiaozuonensis]